MPSSGIVSGTSLSGNAGAERLAVTVRAIGTNPGNPRMLLDPASSTRTPPPIDREEQVADRVHGQLDVMRGPLHVGSEPEQSAWKSFGAGRAVKLPKSVWGAEPQEPCLEQLVGTCQQPWGRASPRGMREQPARRVRRSLDRSTVHGNRRGPREGRTRKALVSDKRKRSVCGSGRCSSAADRPRHRRLAGRSLRRHLTRPVTPVQFAARTTTSLRPVVRRREDDRDHGVLPVGKVTGLGQKSAGSLDSVTKSPGSRTDDRVACGLRGTSASRRG